MRYQLIVAIFILVIVSCKGQQRNKSDKPPSHEEWDRLVSKHVDDDGMVDYQGFISDQSQMDAYLALLSDHSPDPTKWTRNEQLAYWINAYNAFTIKLIMNNYPVESIRDLDPTLSIPLVNTVWHKKFFSIGGVETSLDEIEHSILRKEFNEPRIHFAINCASISCPPLRKEAYTASKLDSQLDEMAIRFINDPVRNELSAETPRISKIFNWFTDDFTKNGTLTDYLNQYAHLKIAEDASFDYLEYNWSLNEAD